MMPYGDTLTQRGRTCQMCTARLSSGPRPVVRLKGQAAPMSAASVMSPAAVCWRLPSGTVFARCSGRWSRHLASTAATLLFSPSAAGARRPVSRPSHLASALKDQMCLCAKCVGRWALLTAAGIA